MYTCHFNFFGECILNFIMNFSIENIMLCLRFNLGLKNWTLDFAKTACKQISMVLKMHAFSKCIKGKWQQSFKMSIDYDTVENDLRVNIFLLLHIKIIKKLKCHHKSLIFIMQTGIVGELTIFFLNNTGHGRRSFWKKKTLKLSGTAYSLLKIGENFAFVSSQCFWKRCDVRIHSSLKERNWKRPTTTTTATTTTNICQFLRGWMWWSRFGKVKL